MLNRVRRARRAPQATRGGVAAPTVVGTLAALAAAGCAPDPLAWRQAEERRLVVPPISAEVPDPAALADSLLRVTVAAALDSAARPLAAAGVGAAGTAPTATPAAASPGDALLAAPLAAPALPILPADPTGQPCPGALRVAAGRGGERVATWWSLRPDRSAALLAARSEDGGTTWAPAVPVDTLDRADVGCARPAPSVAVDTSNGYVHIAYSLVAPEGRGVFYAHRMDPRAPFEVPQVIVYGERAATTSVASAGDLVLVAYEDPNTGGRPFISVAVSRTGGHTWEERVAASEGSMSAERPLVRLRGRDVVLGWVEKGVPPTIGTTEDPRTATLPFPSGVVVRVGQLR